jgi:adenylate cyclase
MSQQRRLAAILFTDIVDSTAIMQKDEQAALSINKRYVFVLKQSVSGHGGEILNDYGDGCLCAFTSATQAVRCAIEIQQQLQTEPKVPLRIGLHIGEMIFEDGKVLGDGVNVASRIQSIGAANSILFSSEICNKLINQPEFKCTSIGKFQFKNVNMPVEVFALCNEGFKVPDKRKMDGKLQEKTTYKSGIILTAFILLLGIVSFFIYRHYFSSPGFTGKEKSIAVLPFEAISSEKENEYINNGFTIDIINKLSKLSGLTDVPGWARVKKYKDFKGSLADIAAELGVAAILTGTIQKQGDKLHIIADLTDVNTGKTIWHTDDDRSWGDVLTLQNEVAEKIASSLSAHLTAADQYGIRKNYTANAEAYNYYIRGRYFWDKRTPAAFDSAEANYKKAIELDPNYDLAYAGLGDIYIFNFSFKMSQSETMAIARDYASKAILLDSTLGESYATLGFIESAYDHDWKKAKLTLEKAIALSPQYTFAHIFYGNLLQYTGQNTQGGIAEIVKALALDPSSLAINWILGRNYYLANEYDLAESQLQKVINVNPLYPCVKQYIVLTLLAKKEFEKAIDLANQLPPSLLPIIGEKGTLLVYSYGISGNMAQAKAALKSVLPEGYVKSHYNLAIAYVGLHEYNLAMDQLDKSINENEMLLYQVKVDPAFIPIRNESRFQRLLKKMNLD